jgi:hypothetical protein
MLMTALCPAWPQAAPSPPSLGVQDPAQQAVPPQGEPAPLSAPPEREDNPGLINEMGKLFEKTLSILPPLKSPQETIEDLNSRAKDAGDSLTSLAKPSSMVTGRIGCPVAANGAPNCKAGADKLCQAKGFKEGKASTPMRRRNARQRCTCRATSAGRATAGPKITLPARCAGSAGIGLLAGWPPPVRLPCWYDVWHL